MYSIHTNTIANIKWETKSIALPSFESSSTLMGTASLVPHYLKFIHSPIQLKINSN